MPDVIPTHSQKKFTGVAPRSSGCEHIVCIYIENGVLCSLRQWSYATTPPPQAGGPAAAGLRECGRIC